MTAWVGPRPVVADGEGAGAGPAVPPAPPIGEALGLGEAVGVGCSADGEGVVVGDETHTSGRVYVSFDQRATQGAHMVGLRLAQTPGGDGPSGQTWLRFDPLTRTLTYSPQRPEVPTLEGE